MNSRLQLSCACLILVTLPLHAGEWKHEFAPYLLAAGLDGTAGVADVTADVDVSFGDILDNLEMGAMGAYQGTRDDFFITVDLIYMGLEADKTGPNGLIDGDAEVQQTMVELDGGYQLNERLGLLAGLRYNNLDAEVTATGPLGNTRSAEKREDWVDPVFGARYHLPIAANWKLMFRGDIGGFGVGSDFAWQAVALARWQKSDRFGVLFGYRYLDVDYEDGSGTNRFEYDVATSGPTAGVVFTF